MTSVPDPESGEVAYSRMRWNTPLSEEHATLHLQRLALTGCKDVLDLGCGWGELLLRAIADLPSAKGVGVDSDSWVLERGRRLAAERQLSERVNSSAADATGWTAAADRVLCIGASHDGVEAPGPERSCPSRPPSGTAPFRCRMSEVPTPGETARAMFGEEVLPLGNLVEEAVAAGWRVLHLSTADRASGTTSRRRPGEPVDRNGCWRMGMMSGLPRCGPKSTVRSATTSASTEAYWASRTSSWPGSGSLTARQPEADQPDANVARGDIRAGGPDRRSGRHRRRRLRRRPAGRSSRPRRHGGGLLAALAVGAVTGSYAAACAAGMSPSETLCMT